MFLLYIIYQIVGIRVVIKDEKDLENQVFSQIELNRDCCRSTVLKVFEVSRKSRGSSSVFEGRGKTISKEDCRTVPVSPPETSTTM